MLRFGRIAAATLLLTPAALIAQAEAPLYLGGSAGIYAGYPQFFSESCTSTEASLSLNATRAIAGALSLRGTLSTSGTVGTTTCVLALMPAPLPGSESTVTSVPSEIDGINFTSTRLELVYEALSIGSVSTRARLGAGRIWNKDLWVWNWGVETRVGSEMFGWVFGVDGLNLAHDATFQRVRWGGPGFGPDVLLESRTIRITERPIRFWTGVEFAVGS